MCIYLNCFARKWCARRLFLLFFPHFSSLFFRVCGNDVTIKYAQIVTLCALCILLCQLTIYGVRIKLVKLWRILNKMWACFFAPVFSTFQKYKQRSWWFILRKIHFFLLKLKKVEWFENVVAKIQNDMCQILLMGFGSTI